MTTVKSPLTATDLRPILRPMRSANSSYSTCQAILPDIPRSISTSKIRSKKRVRFALTLESIEETSGINVPISVEIKTKKRTDDSLYDSYLEYLEKCQPMNVENLNLSQRIRPRPPSPTIEFDSPSPTFTTTYVLPKTKTSDDSVSFPLPPMHLPRIIERTTSPTKKTSTKKSSPNRQRFQFDAIPPRPPSTRKISTQTKRDELTPPLKFASTSRTTSQEMIRSKKLIDVMNNPLPNTNTNTTKRSTSNRTNNDELFFFTSCHSDHIQPIIH